MLFVLLGWKHLTTALDRVGFLLTRRLPARLGHLLPSETAGLPGRHPMTIGLPLAKTRICGFFSPAGSSVKRLQASGPGPSPGNFACAPVTQTMRVASPHSRERKKQSGKKPDRGA
jgi:hypothetical protein